jgi:DNA-directed RNA polymerase subunit RPC12/RpoP
MNTIVLNKLKTQLEHMEYYNLMAPFPVYDTEHVSLIIKKIKIMENDKSSDYDNEPVVACKHCKSLHILNDEVENDICMKCGSINDTIEYANIYEYNSYISKKNE